LFVICKLRLFPVILREIADEDIGVDADHCRLHRAVHVTGGNALNDALGQPFRPASGDIRR
jgi:hypothetical protein